MHLPIKFTLPNTNDKTDKYEVCCHNSVSSSTTIATCYLFYYNMTFTEKKGKQNFWDILFFFQ